MAQQAMVVGRFAPSPSGRMHLGNVFSALLAWLSVRASGGKMILRVEDLDPERCRPAYAETLRDDLRWLGLDWDEESEPQSQRGAVYAEEFARLQEKGLVYPCYCTRSELHDASAPHASDGRVIYAGTCRDLSEAELAKKTRRPAWRLRVDAQTITVQDGLQGSYTEYLPTECGDFIVRRSDGVYAYQLAVVADDAGMGVNQVVRGYDLLSSTPRQIYLYRLLEYDIPQFYHVPLLTAPDGRRLSKRDGDLDLGALRQRMPPEVLVGKLAFAAGLLPMEMPIRASELAGGFSWEQVTQQKTVNIYPLFFDQ